MMGFLDYYVGGGLFMHPVTACGLASACALLMRRKFSKWTIPMMGGLTVALGMMGSSAGLMMLHRALGEAPSDLVVDIAKTGFYVAMRPLEWALLLAAAVFASMAIGIGWERRNQGR